MREADELQRAIAEHWAHRGDLAAIERQLERSGRDASRLAPADLAAMDQLHAGQLAGTRAFAAWVGLGSGLSVLDVGAGLGGPARLLAEEHGAIVTALEPVPELSTTGEELTRRTGLAGRVRHVCGQPSSLDSSQRFDLVWIQHVDIHVREKVPFYATCRRLLARPEGRIVWHDWLAGQEGPPRFPVPWSTDGAISFLCDESAFRRALAEARLDVGRLMPVVDETTGWFQASRDAVRRVLEKAAVVGEGRLRKVLEEAENVLWNMDAGRLVPIFAEAMPSASEDGMNNDRKESSR